MSTRVEPVAGQPTEMGGGSGCACDGTHATTRRIVVTGGPGAGKTATLALLSRSLCPHVAVLHEAASIVFSGGFPREATPEGRRAAQRAIFHIQRELEAIALTKSPAIVVCDRGSVDGAAYWPGPESFWPAVGTTQAAELARYDLVIHLRSPKPSRGYNHVNQLRTESAEAAHEIDLRILEAWKEHPRRIIVDSHRRFVDKAQHAIDAIRAELPACCYPATRP